MKFKNREGTNLNRKKLKIISQSPTEMYVLMEENADITQEGTPLNAEVFNEFQQTIDTSKNQSTSAVSVANNALDIANEAKNNSLNAIENATTANNASSTALNVANEAKTTSINAINKATESLELSNTALNNANDASLTANNAKTNADSAITSITTLSPLVQEAKDNADIAKTKADNAYQKSEEAINKADSVRNDFNSLNDLNLVISSSMATWACNDVNSLPTSFGVNATENSNVKFSSNGSAKTNVVIDGDFYGQEGQKKVAYKTDIPTKTSSLTNDSNFITASSNITGNANTSTRASVLSGSDTRSTDSNPEYYFSKAIGSVCELKNGSTVGLSSYANILLVTNIPWNNSTYGLPTQIAYAPNGKIFSRSASNNTNWDSWKQVVLNSFDSALVINSPSQTFTNGLPQTGRGAGQSVLTRDCLAIFNPATANDACWIRVTGTGESDTVLEIATGDDSGNGESIVVRQYNTSNAVARQATLLGTDGNTSFPGNLTVNGYINANSDIRLKKDIIDINEDSVKKFIEGTSIKSFTYTNNNIKTVGVIAQDIENKTINNASFTEMDKDGYLRVHETKFVYLLWNYCQQLNKRINKLERIIKEK